MRLRDGWNASTLRNIFKVNDFKIEVDPLVLGICLHIGRLLFMVAWMCLSCFFHRSSMNHVCGNLLLPSPINLANYFVGDRFKIISSKCFFIFSDFSITFWSPSRGCLTDFWMFLSGLTRWWFQIFFIVTPTWGNDPIWAAYFSNGLVQPSTSDMFTLLR